MNKFTVSIDAYLHQRILHWVRKADKLEVSGFGKVVLNDDGTARVVDAILLDQENAVGHTQIDAPSLAKAMYLLRETPGHMNFWWHSHGRGQVFFSQQDYDTIEQLSGAGFLIATVFNTWGESRTAFGISSPCIAIFDDGIALRTDFPIPSNIVAQWNESYVSKVRVAPELTRRERRLLRIAEARRLRDLPAETSGVQDG